MTESMPTMSTRASATRAVILRAAFDSFAERGFAASSLREIAQRAGITHTGLRHYFKGKDELLRALIERQDTETERRGSPEPDDRTSGPDALVALLHRAADEWRRSPEFALLRTESAVAASRPDHPSHDYFSNRYRRVRERLRNDFLECAEVGTLREGVDPERAAALWLAVQDGLMVQWLLDPEFDIKGPIEEFVRALFAEPAATQAQDGPAYSSRQDPVHDRSSVSPHDVASAGGGESAETSRSQRPESWGRGPTDDQAVRRATIQDVARKAGVSPSAVSKVLRDAYGVSPQMRARVSSAIEELGYRPNAGARGMRGRSYTVGVTLTAISSPFQPELVEGLTGKFGTTPFQPIIVNAGSDPGLQRRSIEALLDRQVDGLVLISPFMDPEWLEDLGKRVPTVVVARHGGSTSYDTVVDDEDEGTRLMVEHLVDLGHERIVHIGQSSWGLERPFVVSNTLRSDGYTQAMRRLDLEPDVIVTSHTEQGGYEAAVEALARPTPPTAIFAGADIAALGVLRAAEERGLRVPEVLTVVGYDNIYMSTIGRISLTTIDQSAQTTGADSARLLLERLAGRVEPVHHVISPRLVVRGTSAPPPERDRT
ncbi:substrate-binding domain-containing protein [Nonomuraea sp. NPDC049129]|uniref:substrate-binding domain-containing protein n=1 Tax=Nonomuraea sp. NPDC049129 TaxID=3155272 RepID=UPI0033FAA336